jgi:hypothetical protein
MQMARIEIFRPYPVFQALDALDIMYSKTDDSLWVWSEGRLFPQIDSNVLDFRVANFQTTFVLKRDHSLSCLSTNTGEEPFVNLSRVPVDQNVASWWPVDAQTVFVRGFDFNLWYTPAPFGQVPNPNRLRVDGNVLDWRAAGDKTVFVLGYDRNLWYTPAPFGQVPNPNRLLVDSNAGTFQALDANTVFVLGWDGNLWYTPSPFGQVPNPNRLRVASNVWDWWALDSQNVVVRQLDGTLWYVQAPFGQSRNTVQIDAKVEAWWVWNSTTIFILGTDRNLWYTRAPFGQVPNPNRLLVDSNVSGFEPSGGDSAPGAPASPPIAFVLRTNGELWWMASIGQPWQGQENLKIDTGVWGPPVFPWSEVIR